MKPRDINDDFIRIHTRLNTKEITPAQYQQDIDRMLVHHGKIIEKPAARSAPEEQQEPTNLDDRLEDHGHILEEPEHSDDREMT